MTNPFLTAKIPTRPVFSIIGNQEDPNFADHFAIAIASCNPPLQFEAQARTTFIIESRLELLGGADRFEAEKLFEALSNMPPIEAGRLGYALYQVSQKELITPEAIIRYIKSRRTERAEPLDDDGFQASEGVVIDDTKGTGVEESSRSIQFSFDALGSIGDAGKIWGEVVKRLSHFTDLMTQRALVSDCYLILNYRLCLDLGASFIEE